MISETAPLPSPASDQPAAPRASNGDPNSTASVSILPGASSSSSAHPSSRQLKEFPVNQLVQDSSWTTEFNFKLDKGATGDLLENFDICKIIGKRRKELGWPPQKASPEILRQTRLYFDTNAYPPPKLGHAGGLPDHCPSFHRLKLELERAAHSCGCPIVCNGCNSTRPNGLGSNDRVFKCCFKHRQYRDSRTKIIRRCSTKLAVGGEQTCRFRIVIAWDQFGFYLKQTAGHGRHNNHPRDAHKDRAIPSRLRIPEEEKEEDNAHKGNDDDGGFGQDDWGGVSDDDEINTNSRPPSQQISYQDIRKRRFHELNKLLDDVHASDPEKKQEKYLVNSMLLKPQLGIDVKPICKKSKA